jgi:dienelactone hydrolase
MGIASYLSYNPSTSGFDLKQPILYQLPDPAVFGPGPYPVFVWTPGTYEVFGDPLSLLFISQMAQRGFLAASVQYSNTQLMAQTCTAYTQRAQGVFDAARSTSAVSTLCALSSAQCQQGVVTAGISQGGMLAVLARNYTPSVKAAYALSAGAINQTGVGIDLTACLGKQNTTIPANRLTIVNGQADPGFGSQASTQGTSGFTCPTGSSQCWSPDGSGAGWYLVQSSQMTDGTADHCYIDVGGCNDKFDPHWLPSAASNWSLGPNLDWLSTFGTRRVFSSNGQ